MGVMAVLLVVISDVANAHNVGLGDQAFLEQNLGVSITPYMYLGAKHMVTGYDHLLYLAGVIFFLFKIRNVVQFVSLFALGHSITLIAGVLGGWYVNPSLVDAAIGLSIIYKAFENLGGFKSFFGYWLDARTAVFVFGLIHGFGLSAKLQDFSLSQEGLVANLISFNVGVELGQLTALIFLVIVFNILRQSKHFYRNAVVINTLLMASGVTLMGYHMAGYLELYN